ncbi:potassium transporter KefB [Oceanidesulfovibrio indonesiensis]|uniref:Potassium transporter KefB n=1 Tax=Oceanidesulfovibrio indonesiensis TaxID=54767 RepID=A0A7M3MII3_9BACT|nr:cation:proton antiporter [Oceanidesulfovibrio indonesiensis]TVM19506.1 potassium transporter KefB [Oceanidesulfovibrio indonesiensis]
MDLPILSEFVVIFGLSIAVIFIFHKIRVPAIVGFLLTGILAGPHGFGLVKAVEEVEIMADVGVILLLFTIGLELSAKELIRLKKPVFVGGAVQLFGTILVFFIFSRLFDYSSGQALLFGFLAATSCTTIVLKIWQDSSQIESPHGRVALSVLIFQDMMSIPMILLVPFLAGQEANLASSLLVLMVKAVAVLAVVFLLSRYVVPTVLLNVVRTKSRELFLITTLAICLSIAFLTSEVGLSLALGAFLAGLIISESEFSLSALGGVIPFRDVFTSLFFISIGMLLNSSYLFAHLPMVLLVVAAIIAFKAVIAGSAAIVLGYPLRTAVLLGLALAQIGEFSFIIAKLGLDNGVIGNDAYQLFLAASIATMAITPFAMRLSPAVADRLESFRIFAPLMRRPTEKSAESGAFTDARDHLIIVGYGISGRSLERAARTADIPHVIIEMNPDTVRAGKKKGIPIFYGDATQDAVLEHARIGSARVLAVVIPDAAAARRIVESAKELNPSIHVVARTRFISETEELRRLGAEDVIPEEFETAIEIFTRVLCNYMIPRQQIQCLAADMRAEGYSLLREERSISPLIELDRRFSDMDVSGVTIEPGSSAVGKTLEELALRRDYGVTVVAVGRDGHVEPNPDGMYVLQAGDLLYMFGKHTEVTNALGLFTTSNEMKRSPS